MYTPKSGITDVIKKELLDAKEGSVITYEQIGDAIKAKGIKTKNLKGAVVYALTSLKHTDASFECVPGIGYKRVSKEEKILNVAIRQSSRDLHVVSFTKKELMKIWDLINIPDNAEITISY